MLPLLQVITPVQLLAVNIATSFPQMFVLSLETNGAFGAVPLIICIVFDATLVPHAFVQVAV